MKKSIAQLRAELKSFIKAPDLFDQLDITNYNNITGDNDIYLSKKLCTKLSEAIKKHSGTILSIKLVNLRMTDANLQEICQALLARDVTPDKQPKILDFSNNLLTNESVEILKNLNFEVDFLNLNNNCQSSELKSDIKKLGRFDDIGIANYENETNDTVLYLGLEQRSDLCDTIKNHVGSISSIKLVNLRINDASLEKICQALLARNVTPNKQPKILDFSDNLLTDKSIKILKALNFEVVFLNLNNNHFTDEALKFKGSILTNTIHKINLNKNCIKHTESINDFPFFKEHISCYGQKYSPDDCELVGDTHGQEVDH